MLIVVRQPSKWAVGLFAASIVLAALLSWGGIYAFFTMGMKIITKLACIFGFATS